MPFLLQIVAGLQIASGILIFASAASAIHEILGTLMIGFAILTFALAAILTEIKSFGNKSARPNNTAKNTE